MILLPEAPGAPLSDAGAATSLDGGTAAVPLGTALSLGSSRLSLGAAFSTALSLGTTPLLSTALSCGTTP